MEGTRIEMNQMSLVELFAREIDGGPDAPGAACELDARFRERLEWFVSGVSGVDHADAEDVVQCAFLEIWRCRDLAPTEEDHLRGWIFRIAKNEAIDFVRRHGAMDPLPEIDPATKEAGPQTQVRRKERDDRLRAAVEQLPAPIQAAVKLRILQGAEVEEVARALDVSTRRVRKRVERGCELMRPLLGPGFEDLVAAA